jgi:hypothetical protein
MNNLYLIGSEAHGQIIPRVSILPKQAKGSDLGGHITQVDGHADALLFC